MHGLNVGFYAKAAVCRWQGSVLVNGILLFAIRKLNTIFYMVINVASLRLSISCNDGLVNGLFCIFLIMMSAAK